MPGNACSHLLDFGSVFRMAGIVAPDAEVKKILEYCQGVGNIGAEKLKEIGRATITIIIIYMKLCMI